MTLSNDIVLRPRFKFNINANNEEILRDFEVAKTNQYNFHLTRIDDHVFIKLPKHNQHFWSPQLHLEINANDSNSSTVHGLFGPNPTVWTMFMFFHVIVVALFLGFGVWTYTNLTLDNSFAIQLFLTLLMIVFWFVLYFAGRLGRAKGKPEMHQLHKFMKEILTPYF